MTNIVAASLTFYNKHNISSSLTGRTFSTFWEPNSDSPQRFPDAENADSDAGAERQIEC